jgi:hypothetical protein
MSRKPCGRCRALRPVGRLQGSRPVAFAAVNTGVASLDARARLSLRSLRLPAVCAEASYLASALLPASVKFKPPWIKTHRTVNLYQILKDLPHVVWPSLYIYRHCWIENVENELRMI